MVKWLVKLGLKCVSFQTLVSLMAQGLAYIVDYARKNASNEGWEKAKNAVRLMKNWLVLFDEIYEDDTLTSDEEKKIQDAIANCTATTSIYNLLQGKKSPKEASKKSTPKTKKRTTTKKVAEK